MGPEKAEFIFSDPPYNLEVPGNVCGLGRIHHENFAMASGEMPISEFTTFLRTVGILLSLRDGLGGER